MKSFTIYRSDTIQNAQNKYYPHGCRIENLDQLQEATHYDHTPALFQRDLRANENFIESNVVIMDLDNTHTNAPAHHKTIDDIKAAFPDVQFYYIYSRNHQREKKKGNEVFGSRCKVHIYFPLSETYSVYRLNHLQNVKKCTAGLFPYFDHAAIDAGRFFFGADRGGGFIEGSLCLNDYLKDKAKSRTLTGDIFTALNNADTEAKTAGETWPEINQWRTELTPMIGSQATQPQPVNDSESAGLVNIGLPRNLTVDQEDKCLYVERFLDRHSIYNEKATQGNYTYYYIHCPWESEHTEPDKGLQAKISVLPKPDGGAALNYICRHAHCTGKGWHDIKALYEPPTSPQSDFKTTDREKPTSGSIWARIDAQSSVDGTPAKPDNVLDYINGQMSDDIARFKHEIKTGFNNLDKEIGGLYPGLYVLAAISSLGKTTLASQIADQIAATGNDVLFFSLEQSRLELVTKSIARQTFINDSFTAVSSLSMRRGYLPERVLKAAEQYSQKISNHLSIIEGNFGNNISFIEEYIREYIKRNTQPDQARPVVFIDYLQVLQPEVVNNRQMSVRETVDNSVITLKRLSREMDVTIIVICSVNRSNYLTPIDFESLKESGGIEYTADVVLGLQLRCLREEIFNNAKTTFTTKRARITAAKAENPRKIEMTCLKNRYGRSSFDDPVCFDYYPKNDCFMESKFI